jgi:hypothetical protein
MAVAGSRHNGTSSNAPQVMTNLARTFQYGVLVKKLDGSVRIWRKDLTLEIGDPGYGLVAERTVWVDEQYIYHDVGIGTALGNLLTLPIKGGGYDTGTGSTATFDDHYAFALGVDSQDRIWIAGNQHATSPKNVIRCTVAANGAWDATWVASWGAPAAFWLQTPDDGIGGYTYNRFDRTDDGTLLFMFDQQETAASSRGRDWLLFFLPVGAGTTWSKYGGTGATDAEWMQTQPVGPIGTAADVTDPPPGWFPTDTRTADRAYCIGSECFFDADGVEWFAAAGIWRTLSQRPQSQQQPFYIKIRVADLQAQDKTAWVTVDGHAQAMPITWANRNTAGGTISPARPAWDLPAPWGAWVARARGATVSSAAFAHSTTGHRLAHDEGGWPHLVIQNGSTWQGPLAGSISDNGIEDEPLGLHPFYSNPSQVHLHHYWDPLTDDWEVAPMSAGAHGSANGPRPFFLKGGGGGMFIAGTSGGSGARHRVTTKAGGSGSDILLVGTTCPSGATPNPDPVLMADGIYSIMVPDYDTPRSWNFGGHKRMN